MNTSRFVLWFCASGVSNIIICENVCVVARDKNCVVVVCVIFFVRCGADEHINIR